MEGHRVDSAIRRAYPGIRRDMAKIQAASAERLVSLVLAWPLLAVNAKRLHDRGRSGAWALALLVRVLGWLWLMAVNGSVRGTAGANRYGPPPSG